MNLTRFNLVPANDYLFFTLVQCTNRSSQETSTCNEFFFPVNLKKGPRKTVSPIPSYNSTAPTKQRHDCTHFEKRQTSKPTKTQTKVFDNESTIK